MRFAFHIMQPGNHAECGPDCAVTGDLCCGGQVRGVCSECDGAATDPAEADAEHKARSEWALR